ncbi:N-acetyllactosaminide beta-1,3-N-acetylglucosaminyltransferase 3 [Bagarius yarrelli]|uniref:Hexosyltransferase n=1 Tax=Bagarius yarrelli TaxID=175774 RepID=A0A556VW79_BAGYA|nr:N-acetyllactosaminide beta-1,3-N-acetylglucosaminyltransferase 3 [Bagarius yarrelli]
MTLIIINTMCLLTMLKIIAPENCEKITSLKSIREAQPPEITTPMCEKKQAVEEIKGFFDLPANIQEFLYYRHCRDFPALLTLPNKCMVPKGSRETFLLLVIKSSPTNYEQQAVLRKTWAKERTQDGMFIRTVFLTGTSGFSLEKLRVLFLDWMQDWCLTADFFFNGDDDIFANTDNMVDFLKGQRDIDGSKHMFTGHMLRNSVPIRDNNTKYYIPEQIEPNNLYPPYCSGGGYILSRFTAMTIFHMSLSVTLMPIDDVYMCMCLEKAGLIPSTHKGVWANGLILPSKKMDELDPCFYRDMILGHKFLPHEIFLLWDQIHSKDLNCAKKMSNL